MSAGHLWYSWVYLVISERFVFARLRHFGHILHFVGGWGRYLS